MYESYYGLWVDPFRLNPTALSCFEHSTYRKAKSYMLYALQKREGILMVTGHPGTGKTTLIREVVAESADFNIHYTEISSSQLDANGLISLIALKCGIDSRNLSKSEIIVLLEMAFRRLCDQGRRPVLFIDEAQVLSIEALEEARHLTNMQYQDYPLVQLFLVGQPDLKKLVQQPELEQLLQRVTAACELKPMSVDEVKAYVLHCLEQGGWLNVPTIDDGVFEPLHAFSQGIPRMVNLICGRLLLNGMVEKSENLDQDDVQKVVSDLISEGLLIHGLPPISPDVNLQ